MKLKVKKILLTLIVLTAIISQSFGAEGSYTLVQKYSATTDSIIIYEPNGDVAFLCLNLPAKTLAQYQPVLNYQTSISSIRTKTLVGSLTRELFVDYKSPLAILHIKSSKKSKLTMHLNFSKNSLCTVMNDGGELIQSEFGCDIKQANSVRIYFSPVSSALKYGEAIANFKSQTYAQTKKLHVAAYQKQIENYYLRLPQAAASDLNAFNFSRHIKITKQLSNSLWAGFYFVDCDSTFHFPLKENNADSLMASKLVDFSQGLIDILPSLPEAWAKSGRMVGLAAPGGFKVSVVWANGLIKTLVIRSSLGGNCRLRVPHAIDACPCLGMHEAQGPNPNNAFSIQPLSIPVSSNTQTFDFETYPGQVIVISGK